MTRLPRFPPPEERQSLRGWRPSAASLVWLACAVLGLGTWLGFEWVNTRRVAAELDARIARLRQEIEDGEQAAAHHEAIRARLGKARADLNRMLVAMPCEMGLTEFLADLRARLEPLGAQVRSDLGWQRERDFYREAGIPVVVPAGAQAAAREAVAGLGRLVRWQPWGDTPDGHVLTVVSWKCRAEPPPLDPLKTLVPGRESVPWMMEGPIRRREAEIDALRTERERLAPALRDQRLLDALAGDSDAARRVLEVLTPAPERGAPAPGDAP